jgi:hypothetical protein
MNLLPTDFEENVRNHVAGHWALLLLYSYPIYVKDAKDTL